MVSFHHYLPRAQEWLALNLCSRKHGFLVTHLSVDRKCCPHAFGDGVLGETPRDPYPIHVASGISLSPLYLSILLSLPLPPSLIINSCCVFRRLFIRCAAMQHQPQCLGLGVTSADRSSDGGHVACMLVARNQTQHSAAQHITQHF